MPRKKTKIQEVAFHHVKSPDYKAIHASGIFGGFTPKGELFFELFHEQIAGAKQVIHSIREDGSLGEMIKREEKIAPKEGTLHIERQMQVGVSMSLDVAESIAKWMLRRVEEFKKQIEEAGKGTQDADA